MSRSIVLDLADLCLVLPHKTCFANVSARVHQGDRIALIGDNGSGKSSLLKGLLDKHPYVTGQVQSQGRIAYLPQDPSFPADSTVWSAAATEVQGLLDALENLEDSETYEECLDYLIAHEAFDIEARLEALLDEAGLLQERNRLACTLSGGERMRLRWVSLLISQPDLLLLDEPTNHLDGRQREWLVKQLNAFKGAVIMISHDLDLLQSWPQQIWQLHREEMRCFNGIYSEYIALIQAEEEAREAKRAELSQRKKKLVSTLQNEATRQVRTEKQGKKRYFGDPLLGKGARERAENTMGRAHKKRTHKEKEEVSNELRELRQSKPTPPRFHLRQSRRAAFCLQVENGTVSYPGSQILSDLNFQLRSRERVSLSGDNGSGKTTLMRALVGDPLLILGGKWELPALAEERIAYLDQHYSILDAYDTVGAALKLRRPDWSEAERLRHLNSFLFTDFRVVEQQISSLSEGEKARLSLALLAADAPDLLILDEVSNNLDLGTKEHLIQVLNAYEGALLVNSHETAFLEQLSLDSEWVMEDGSCRKN